MIVAAVDIGGTRVKAGAVDVATGAVVMRLPVSPSGTTWQEAQATVENAVARVAEEQPVAGVGIAVPGVVDGGRIRSLPGKLSGAEGAMVAEWAASLLAGEGPVVVVNDAVAAAVGEAVAGAGAGARRAVVVTLGTGVGVCVVEDGQPLGRGPFGGGILGGQIPIGVHGSDGGPVDTSGRHGTIESRCRAEALVAHGRRAGGAWQRGEEITAAADVGDPAACAAVAAYRRDLVAALTALAAAHGPEIVVVGGGPAEAAGLVDGLGPEVGSRVGFGLSVEVVAAALGSDAALAGLGLLAGRLTP